MPFGGGEVRPVGVLGRVQVRAARHRAVLHPHDLADEDRKRQKMENMHRPEKSWEVFEIQNLHFYALLGEVSYEVELPPDR